MQTHFSNDNTKKSQNIIKKFNKHVNKMKETKKNTVYQTPKVTIVTFKVEDGFVSPQAMEGNGNETFDQNGDSDQNSLFVPFN